MATTEARMKQLTGAYADLPLSNMLVGEMAVPSDHVPVVRNGVNSWENLLTSESAGDIIALSETMTEQIDSFEQLVIDKVGINDSTATLTQAYSGSKTQGLIDGINTNLSTKATQSALDTTNATVALNTNNIVAHTTQIASLASGAPKAVSLVSQMTDTAKNYVYTGVESGYTSGNWYYWNGSIWESGGTYQAAAIPDNIISKIKLDDNIRNALFQFNSIIFTKLSGYYASGVFYSSSAWDSAYIACSPGDMFALTLYSLASADMPIATFYNSSGAVISYSAKSFGENIDYIISIPAGCVYFSTSSKNDQGIALGIKKLELNNSINPKAYTPLYLTIKQGYYVNGVFYSSPAWDSVYIACNPKDKYAITSYLLGSVAFPLVTFYNSSGARISDTGAVTTNTTFTDYEIVIPENCYYFSTGGRNVEGIHLKVKKYDDSRAYKKKPLSGLKCLVFGDSISSVFGRWRSQFYNITGMTEIACKAVSGAHLADYSDTVLDGTTFTGSGNTVNNQIQAILNNPVDTPDIIIISAITNDVLTDTQLNTETEVFVSGTSYIDISTIDRTTIEGAMRWQVEKLYTLYPNAKIFYASAIQAVENTRTGKSIVAKEKKMIRIAERMSVNVIKAGTQSGIYGRYEINGANGKYLEDGLHPNELGGRVLGNCYASTVIDKMSYIVQP